MLDANISWRDVENLPCIKKEICDLSRRLALCQAGDVTGALIVGNFTSSANSFKYDTSITDKEIERIPIYKKRICELQKELDVCIAGNPNASPTPTPSVTPSPSPTVTPSPTPTPSNEARVQTTLWGNQPNQIGSTTSADLCNSSSGRLGYLKQSEYNQYLAAGDPSFITIVYDGSTGAGAFDGGNNWFYLAADPYASSTKQAFQLSSSGIPSNFTTVSCPSPSPTPSISPSPTVTPTPTETPTPTPTPTNTPTPSTSTLTSIALLLRTGISPANPVCTDSTPIATTFYISSSENAAFLADGNTAHITTIYTNNTLTTRFDGGNLWYHFSNGSTASIFQIDSNGTLSNHTIIDCTPTASPTASVTPSPTPTITPTPSPTISDSPSPTPSITTTPTPSITATPTQTPTPSITATPTQTPTPSITPTPTGTPTPSVTTTPTPSITPSITPTPSVTVGLFLNGVLLTSTPAVAYATPMVLAAGNNVLTQLGAGSYTLSSLISGAGNLTNNIGAANLITLNNANTFTGGTTLTTGMMATNRAGAFGSAGITLNGGDLRFNNAAFSSGVINMTNTITQNVGTTGLIDMLGSGTASNNLTLNTGATTINGTLKFTRSTGNYGTTSFSSAISGAGTLIVGDTNSGVTPNTAANNQGRLAFTNANAFAGFTGNISVLQRGNLTLSGGQLNGNNVNIATGGYMTLGAGVTTTIGDLSGGGTITKATIVTNTTIRVNTGNFTGSISTVPISGNTAITLTKVGLGLFFIGGSSNYASGTNINAGTFTIGHNNAMGTGIVTLSAGTTLNKNGFTPPNVIVNNGGTVNP